jgi:inorganic triphosphatase YgiF
MPRRIRFPGTYRRAYDEVTQMLLSSLRTVDSAASARTFVSQAAEKIRDASVSVPEFYVGEFFNVFKDAAVAHAGQEVAECERALKEAQDDATVGTAELQVQLDAARQAGDCQAEHAVWREREIRQAACQAKVDAASARMDPIGVRIETVEALATALGLSFN